MKNIFEVDGYVKIEPITPNVIYNVILTFNIPLVPFRNDDYSGDYYYIVDDLGNKSHYHSKLFEILRRDELRDIKFLEIGL